MPGFARAMQVFGALAGGESQAIGQRMLVDMLGKNGNVRFPSILPFHEHVTSVYQFVLRRKVFEKGGYHLLYLRGPLLLRVKTYVAEVRLADGTTEKRPPHMTLSAVAGLDWDDEAMKLTRYGQFIPKQGAVLRASKANDWRSLSRVGPDVNQILASDQAWADACHFNFVDGFDGSAAAMLVVMSA